MKDLMDMINRGCDDNQLVRKIYEMHSSGELNDILQLIESARKQDDSVFETATNITLRYFGCEIDLWYRVDEGFWIRKRNATVFEGVILYPPIEGFYFGFFFEVDAAQLTPEQIGSCLEACPPPDHLYGVEFRQMYSVLRSKDIESANDKLTTENEKLKDLWLKNYGIVGEVES